MAVTNIYTARMEKQEQYSNLWEIQFTNSSRGTPDLDFLPKWVRSVSIPFWQLETETSSVGIKYFSRTNRDIEITIEFQETDDFTAKNALDDWMRNTFNRETNAYATDVERRTGIFMFQRYQDGQLATSKQFILQEMRIKGIEGYDVDYENGEGLITKATFTCDMISEGNASSLLTVDTSQGTSTDLNNSALIPGLTPQ